MQALNPMAYEVPLVSARYARRFARFMESRGVGPEAMLEGVDIDPEVFTNPDAFLSMKQVMQLLSQTVSLIKDERIPFQFGQQLDLPAHGLLGFALLRQQEPYRLVSMIVQYLRVGLPIMDLEMESRGNAVCIRLRDSWNLGELRPFMAKIYMGSILTLATPICGEFLCDFDFPTALDEEQWSSLASNAVIRFGQPANRVVMPLSDRRLMNDERDLSYFLAGERYRRDVRPESIGEVVSRAREHIMNHPGRESALERTAEVLGMSPRSLRRHLSLAGVSFREIRNEIRQRYATRYLTDTTVPLELIASKLGFSDQASFTRAYRSWTGRTPGDVRRNRRQERDLST